MIEQLRIQCPSCGIVLDVKNSKHEAVKRISCPYCKKQLNVNFQEDEQPAQTAVPLDDLYHGEMRIALHEGINKMPLPQFETLLVNVVRLTDGNSKCIVSITDPRQSILVNGEPLKKDDAVSLTIGDKVFSRGAVLTFGKPGQKTAGKAKQHKTEKTRQPSPTPQRPTQPPLWLFALLATLMIVLAVWCFWPEKSKRTNIADIDDITDTNTPSVAKPAKPTTPKATLVKGVSSRPTTKAHNPSSPNPRPSTSQRRTDYDLEQLALQGDVSAQYELGNRLVHKGGANNVVRGIKYLRMASNNGSSQARNVMNKAIRALQSRADNGDSVAYEILTSVNK
jgi:hypothetical protein